MSSSDASLPFAALQQLAPPVRLISAALWKVVKRRDVLQYGMVEEFITAACETVPGLLTLRHQGKLALGLRARLILELCRTKPDAEEIAAHLERIRVPAPTSSSTSTVKKDVKIMKTVESFHCFIQTVLANAEERERFFKERFPVDYGQEFDDELEKLLWEFLVRLDQLLPVPNLAQTVAWLSDAPAVLEECSRAPTQPQLLKILLQHQACLGHLEIAASLPPNMGDSILASLSLPPSGRVASNQATTGTTSTANQLNITQTRDADPFIAPVIGLISNEDVPIMITASKRTIQRDEASTPEDAVKEKLNPKESSKFTLIKEKQKPNDSGAKESREELEERSILNQSGGTKRKQADTMESDSDKDEVLAASMSRKKRMSVKEQGVNESVGREGCRGELLTHLNKLGLRTLHLPDDPSLRDIFASCLSSQPRVILKKLSMPSATTTQPERRGKSSDKGGRDQRKKLPTRHASSRRMPESPALDDKENHPVLDASGSSRQRINAETTALQGDGDDYVADSEDEATKNFKGRLFVKRYYKTKHGTYVPTLREFWKPGVTRRDLLSAGSKRR